MYYLSLIIRSLILKCHVQIKFVIPYNVDEKKFIFLSLMQKKYQYLQFFSVILELDINSPIIE